MNVSPRTPRRAQGERKDPISESFSHLVKQDQGHTPGTQKREYVEDLLPKYPLQRTIFHLEIHRVPD